MGQVKSEAVPRRNLTALWLTQAASGSWDPQPQEYQDRLVEPNPIGVTQLAQPVPQPGPSHTGELPPTQ